MTVPAATMDVLEAMHRRRMHRYFDSSSLDDATLQTFAWAATRAPAGGNQPSRFVLEPLEGQ
jgi:nitroreductase